MPQYDSSLAYHLARLRHTMQCRRLRKAAQWNPLKEPRSGYTIIVPLPWQCWDLAFIPLLALKRAHRKHCVEVILAVNATEQSMFRRHGQWNIAAMVKAFSSLRVRPVCFTSRQERMARRHRTEAVDQWLNIVNGITQTGTRHALLHDPETIVLDPEFFEKHYEVASTSNNTFTGIRRDGRHGSEHSADLLDSAELMIDVAAVRSLFAPIDLYRRVRTHDGRRILCDLLCDAQWRLPDASRVLHEVDADRVLEMSPLFNHWSAMKFSAQTFAPQDSSPLPLLPFFRGLQNQRTELNHACEALERRQTAIRIDGCTVDFSNLDRSGRDRVAHQLELLDRYFTGTQSPEVRRYTHALADHSTVTASDELPMPEIVVNRDGLPASTSKPAARS